VLLAVIAAAVAAYEADTCAAPAIYVRKINRAAGVRPAWAAAGTTEAMAARGL
jgi:hypothetical protein